MEYPSAIQRLSQAQPFPLVFLTISGAHLYGFQSPDSDYDLRGAHILPVRDAIGLDAGRDTIEVSGNIDDVEIDLVTHDVRKFFLMMLKKNGYVLEQLFSPLVVFADKEHEELKQIGRSCMTRHHYYHYAGFAQNQWKLFKDESPRRIKPLLYVYRVLLTGIHLMRAGEIEANLLTLNDSFRLAYLPDLIASKLAGPEQSALGGADFDFHSKEYARLHGVLEEAFKRSDLPDTLRARPALNDLLIRLRTGRE